MGSILPCCLPCGKAGGLQILRCQGIAVEHYSFTLDVLTLKPSGFCNVGVKTASTDLPFKINEDTIVIVKGLPVLQCTNCLEYLIEDEILRWVDEVLAKVEGGTELEIVRYAA
jgi:YgiT-type zinc finger domain-containing protein